MTLVSKTAMVMGAGMGKRMRPLTASRPKPLVKLGGKALIDHCFDKLFDGGIEKLVVNVHYLADALEAHLGNVSYPFDIQISDEREQLLETGGGLVKALPMIGEDPFFCVNSDNVWIDGPEDVFAVLSNFWNPQIMDALLLVVPHQRAYNHSGVGDFYMDGAGRLTRRRSNRVAPFIYTGIQLISRAFLNDSPEGPFSTNILWDRAIAARRLYGVALQGEWFDIGTPAAIKSTETVLCGG